MKALKKRVFMKPIIAVELLLVVLLAGAGVAVALTNNPMGDTGVWLGTATIADADLEVQDYTLNFDVDRDYLESVNVTIHNKDLVNAHSGTMTVEVIDSGSVVATKVETVNSIAADGTADITAIFTVPGVAVGNVGGLAITIDQD